MADERDLSALAREIVDSNLFMTLATADAEGRPWATPVYFTPHEYREFFWMSEPGSRHSRHVSARPEVSIVIFNVLDPAGHPDGSAGDHRAPVEL